MSLIQEALRRKQEEIEAEQNGTVLPHTSAPMKMDDESDVPENTFSWEKRSSPPNIQEAAEPTRETPLRRASADKEHRVLIPLIGAILLLLLLLFFAGWAVMFGIQTFFPTDVTPETVASVTPPAAPPVAPVPEAPLAPPEVAILVDDEIPEERIPETGVTVAEPVIDAAPKSEPETEPMASDQTPPAAPAESLPAPEPMPIIWPDVHVSGVVGTPQGGSAIINGKVVGMHETFENIIVRDIGRGFVVLEYQGETRRFSVGRSVR